MEVKHTAEMPGSLFSQPWWLDAVAPGSWNAVTVERGGEIVARLPYVIRRRYGFTYLTMPPLTQTLGPWLRPYPGKYTNKLSEEVKLMTELIESLPRFDRFEQNFHHSITNWLPFYWEGFQQTTRYTYVVENLQDHDSLWKDLRENIRREIRKAERQVMVRDDLDIDAFLDLNEMTFKRQGLNAPYTRELVTRLDNACRKRDCRKILFAEDNQGRLHAAAYLVWDKWAAYYLMGGGNPELRTSGATSLLIWKSIQFSGTVSRTFDFEGSMVKGVERFFRAFGAQQKSYFRVSKTTHLLLKMLRDVRSWIRTGVGRGK
jgi:lipid II:glycine glycyltransferase (peptidoglycan interpeptide bridge formation enzyme)